jgi:hypothetical protein
MDGKFCDVYLCVNGDARALEMVSIICSQKISFTHSFFISILGTRAKINQRVLLLNSIHFFKEEKERKKTNKQSLMQSKQTFFIRSSRTVVEVS